MNAEDRDPVPLWQSRLRVPAGGGGLSKVTQRQVNERSAARRIGTDTCRVSIS